MVRKLGLVVGLLCGWLVAWCQEPASEVPTSKIINIDTAAVLRLVQAPSGEITYLVGSVQLSHRDMHLFCDSALIQNNVARAFGEVVLTQQDSIQAFCDSLRYDGNRRFAKLYGKEVVLTDRRTLLVGTEMNYDLVTKTGFYENGATLTTDSSVLTSQRGYYKPSTKDAYFKGNVVVDDPKYHLESDTLHINTRTKKTYFVAPTRIVTDNGDIYCEAGFFDTKNNYAEFEKNAKVVQSDGQVIAGDKIKYNGKTKQFDVVGKVLMQKGSQVIQADSSYYDDNLKINKLRGNVYVADSTQTITARNLDYNRKDNKGLAWGNVQIVDTTQQTTVWADSVYYDKSRSYMLATAHPVLQTLVNEDSVFISADTLLTYQPDSTIQKSRVLLAYQHARLYKADFQAQADSLTYNSVDSLFHFYGKPVLWSDSTQFSADTIDLWLLNNKIREIDMRANAMIINTNDFVYFNQIKGRNITAYFTKGQVRQMNVTGNGQSVYYATDAKGYIGVNKAECSYYTIRFSDDNKVERISFYVQPKATVYPMGQVNHQSLRLDGYRWLYDTRPLHANDIMKWRVFTH